MGPGGFPFFKQDRKAKGTLFTLGKVEIQVNREFQWEQLFGEIEEIGGGSPMAKTKLGQTDHRRMYQQTIIPNPDRHQTL